MRRRNQLRPDTFPFLAVLLCAMGSLILVLMELDRRARSAAHGRAEAAWKKEQEDKAELLARLRAERLAELDKHKQQHQQRLAAHQAEKDQLREREQTLTVEQKNVQARIESVLRALQEGSQALGRDEQRHRELQQTAEQARRDLLARQQQTARVKKSVEVGRAERERLTRELLLVEETLQRLREKRERDSKKWSIVPYVGKRGLGRRPLYVECDADKLVFHPGRTTLSSFQLTDRNVREEVQKRSDEHRKNAPAGAPVEPPYWLLLVRPRGIESYYAFIQATKALDLAYGYEFVDASWDFDLPTSPGNAPEPVEVATPLPTPVRGGSGHPARVKILPGQGSPDQGRGTPGQGGGSPGATLTRPGGAAGAPPVAELMAPRGVPGGPGPAAPPGGTGPEALFPGAGAGSKQASTAPEQPGGGEKGPEGNAGNAGSVGNAGGSGSADGADGRPTSSVPPEELPKEGKTSATGGGNAAEGSATPKAPRPGRREYVLVVECRPDSVELSPSRLKLSLAELQRGKGGEERLLTMVRQLIEQRRQGLPPGEAPRVIIRFLVHPQSLRTYHLTYPLLDTIDAEKRAVLSSE